MPTTFTDRSYSVRRQIGDPVPAGTRVRFTEPFTYYRQYPEGTTGTLRSFSNAGFRGIEAWVTLDDGTEVYSVSAGKLERA